MKTQRHHIKWLLAGTTFLLGTLSASAHIGYTGRDFGTVVPNSGPVTLTGQAVTGSYGWADGTDADFGDAHRVRAFRFRLEAPAQVTIRFSGSTNGGTRNGNIKPGFSVYQGLAHLPPFPAGGSADYDFSAITAAYLATLEGPSKEGAFRALADWRAGGDSQQGPVFDFEDPVTGLSTFTYMGHAVDGNGSLVGGVPGLRGDGNLDGTVTGTFDLPAGDYSIFVGGIDYSGQLPTPDPTSYGLVGTVSATAFVYAAGDPVEGGVTYDHRISMDTESSGSFSGHVGAWSWEDNALFDAGEPPVGWTHTSEWLALKLLEDCMVTITMERDANVPWPSEAEPDRKADTSSMFPSLTVYSGWDNDGEDGHSYNNRGNIAWAEDLSYVDHVDNSTAETITRTWFMKAGEYTLALGSNAPATNLARQGYRFNIETTAAKQADPVPTAGGIGYFFTLNAANGTTGHFSTHVGAWSWEDKALFAPGEQPVGWTHTSRWVAVNVSEEEVYFTVKVERDENVPWPGEGLPDRLADTSSMFPSLTVYRGWDNDGGNSHTYNNRGNVAWAEDIRYLDHVDNSTATSITRTWRLPRGQYSIAVGSNAPATNTLRQGLKFSYSAMTAAPLITGDPVAGGVGYAWMASVGVGDSGEVANHVGAWSWEDNALFDPGEPPVGWTHTSRWLGMHLKEPLTLTVTMSRNANVPWPAAPAGLNGLADVSSMFPSFTLWRGWHNHGTDSHTYNNRGPVAWAPGLRYVDHLDNSTAETVTRTWTLQPGHYTFAMGSNAPATNANRQGFTFSWSAERPQWKATPLLLTEVITKRVVEGRRASFSGRASGEGVSLQWMHDGKPVPGATSATLVLPAVTVAQAGVYTLEARNDSGWLQGAPQTLVVISRPVMAGPPSLPDGVIGQPYLLQLPSVELASYEVRGLPRGLNADRRTGVIAGRPVVAGTFPVSLVMINPAGRSEPVTADLVIQPMPVGTVGNFIGALGRAPLLNDQLGGCLTITASSLGGYSVQLKLGRATHRATGMLSLAPGSVQPSASLTISRRGQAPVVVAFTVQSNSGVAEGTISDGATTLPFRARRPEAGAEALAGLAGGYTFAMSPDLTRVGDATVPQGFSVGGFAVDARGMATGAIRLADDSAFTFAGPIEAAGHLTVFKLLYRNTGSVVGVLSVQSAAAGDVRLSEMSWLKKRQPAQARDRLYKDGFGPLELEVVGRKMDLSLEPIEALGLTPSEPDDQGQIAGNTSLSFAHGGVTDPATQLDVAAAEVVPGEAQLLRVISANPGAVQLRVLASSRGSGGGKAVFKEFTFVKNSDRRGLSHGQFTVVDVDTSTGAAVNRSRTGSLYGTIVDDGNGPRMLGYFLLPELLAPGASPAATRAAPMQSGSWQSH
jgi:hypothetical protein